MNEIGNFIVAHWETILGVLLLLLATDGIAGYLPDKWVPYVGAVKRIAQILLTRFGKGVPIILAVLLLGGCAGLKMEETAAPMAIPPPPGLSSDGARGIRVEGAVAMGTSRLTPIHVAALPASPSAGESYFVDDATDVCTVIGGGATAIEVVYDGSAWKSKICAGSISDVDDLPGDTVDDNLIDRALLAGLTTVDTPVWPALTLGTANTTTGLLNFYSNTAGFPFGLYAAGSAAPGVGWRFPATMASGDSYVWVNTLGNLDYTLKTTLAHFVQAADDPDANDDITTYLMGTIWHNTTDDGIWQLADNTDTAAVWVELTATGSISDLDDLPGDTVDDNLIDAAIVAGLAAIDTEAELEALLELADLQGDLDPDRMAGDTVDDNKVDAAILAITSMDLNYSASEASGQPMNADRTYSGIPHTGFICSEIMQHGYPVFVNSSAQLQVADADGASMAPAWGVFVLHQKLTGTHNGSADAATLSDSTAAFTVDAYIGSMVFNITDQSECIVTDNDGTTVTCTLSGGTDNDWDASDAYEIGLPAYLDNGWIRDDVWNHTAGATVYLDDTEGYPVEAAGAPATTGDIYQPIGIAIDADRIMLKVDPVNGWYTYAE